MGRLDLSGRELAYLLGCVGAMLIRPGLGGEHRRALGNLRDRLAPHVPVDDDVAQVLGLPERQP